MIPSEPEDLIGKWFSNLHGLNYYYFILDVYKKGDEYVMDYFSLRPRAGNDATIYKESTFNSGNLSKQFGSSIEDNMTIDKLKKRVVKTTFKGIQQYASI